MRNVFNLILLGFVLHSSHALLIGVRVPYLLVYKPALVHSLSSECGGIDHRSVHQASQTPFSLKRHPYTPLKPRRRSSLSRCHAAPDDTVGLTKDKQNLAVSKSDSDDAPLPPYAIFVAILLLVVNIHSQWTRALVYYLVSFKAPDNAESLLTVHVFT